MVAREQRLHLFAGTWNVNGRAPEASLDLAPWLLPPPSQPPYDVYMLGMQEIQSLTAVDALRSDPARGKEWRSTVEALLRPRGFALLTERQLVGILVLVFIHRDHAPFVSSVAVSYAGTGFLNVGGNKGAVAARFRLYNRTLACVSCHLTAHDGNVDRRNQDFRDITQKAMFASADLVSSAGRGEGVYTRPSAASRPPAPLHTADDALDPFGGASSSRRAFAADAPAYGAGGKLPFRDPSAAGLGGPASSVMTSAGSWIGSVANAAAVAIADINAGANYAVMNDPNALNILDHDAVFWLGDFNYRIDAPQDEVVRLVNERDWVTLVDSDQLFLQMQKVPVFRGFMEGPIGFAPTFKYDRYVDRFSVDETTGALKRTPAYTDRILYRCGLPSASPTSKPDLTLIRYSSAKVYSSDHRPVLATFSMTFLQHEAETSRHLPPVSPGPEENDLSVRESKPSIRLSSSSISVGTVRFERKTFAELVVTNDGKVPVSLAVPVNGFPPWLSLSERAQHSIGALHPGRSVTIGFTIFVSSGNGSSLALASGAAKLRASCEVQINRGIGPTYEFEISGRYPPTCLGTSLDFLAMCADPVDSAASVSRSLQGLVTDTKYDIQSMEREQRAQPSSLPLSCPKEIWWLVDLLWRKRDEPEDHSGSDDEDTRRWIHHESARRLFLSTGELSMVDVVQNHIDRGLAIPHQVNLLAVGTCLVNLLRSLEVPVIPFAAYHDALHVAKKREGSGVADFLTRIPSLNGNVFRYIICLLRELPVVQDKSGISDLADIFGEVLLAPNRDRPNRDLRERAAFVRLALEHFGKRHAPKMAVVDIGRSSLCGTLPPSTASPEIGSRGRGGHRRHASHVRQGSGAARGRERRTYSREAFQHSAPEIGASVAEHRVRRP